MGSEDSDGPDGSLETAEGSGDGELRRGRDRLEEDGVGSELEGGTSEGVLQ